MSIHGISFDASQISQWASLPDAPYRLPELVRKLVMSDVDTLQISEIRMPSGSSVRLPGLDGWLNTANSNPWVPRGSSAWEFSCDKSVKQKATEDYNKRTGTPQNFNRAETTFVFVTARRCASKDQWSHQRNQEGQWFAVRMLDADDLVAWIEQAPEVAIWFATINTVGQFIPSLQLSQMDLGQHHQETVLQNFTAATDAGIEKLKSHFDMKFAVLAQQADSKDSASSDVPEITQEIDQAGELLSLGLIKTAYRKLEELNSNIATYSPAVAFRITTNIAMCCLANQELEQACFFFDTAHKYQPTNHTAIANAALAARLRNDGSRAVELASQARAISPHDSQATSVLIEGLWQTNASDKIENLLHNEPWVLDDNRCILALANVREQQGHFENATELYRTLVSSDPTEVIPHLALSLCLLNRARANRHQGLTRDQHALIEEAETTATKTLEILSDTQLHAHRHVATIARGIARSLLGRTEHALSDFDSVPHGAPAQSEAAFHKMLLILHVGRTQEAQRTFEQISDPDRHSESVQALTSHLIKVAKPLTAVTLLQDEFTLEKPTWDDVSIAELLITAELAAGITDTVGPKITSALRLDPTNYLIVTLSAIHAHLHGDSNSAIATLEKIVKFADTSDIPKIETALVTILFETRQFDKAARILHKIVDGNAAHPLAVTLLICLSNKKEYRKSLEWSRRIRSSFINPPKMVLEIEHDILRYAGDIQASTALLQHICNRDDATIVDRANLAEAQFRTGQDESAKETLSLINSSEFKHDHRTLLSIAQIKYILEMDGALDDALIARSFGINDHVVHLGYFQLFISIHNELDEPDSVVRGCFVHLNNQDQKAWWYVPEDGELNPMQHQQVASNDLTSKLLGARTGDTITLRQDIETLSYSIEAIQSKYVRAFQETASQFSTRFPENQGLSSVEIDLDNPLNLLQIIDQHDTFAREAIDLYHREKIPFAVFASLLGKSVPEVWHAITESGMTHVYCGDGSADKARASLDWLKGANGIILDFVAMLTVHALGIVDLLHRRFERVLIPQYVIDQVQKAVFEDKVLGHPPLSFGKNDDGIYTLTDCTHEDWNKRRQFLKSILMFAKTLEPIASYRALDLDTIDDLDDSLFFAIVGSCGASEETTNPNLVLVSDDIKMVELGVSLDTLTVSTQTVLEDLHRSGTIDHAKYASLVEHLVLLNYRFIRISADVIVRRLEANEFLTTKGIRSMLGTISGPDCLENSALAVAVDLICKLATSTSREQMGLILPLVLEALKVGRSPQHILQRFRRQLIVGLHLVPQIRAEVIDIVDFHLLNYATNS